MTAVLYPNGLCKALFLYTFAGWGLCGTAATEAKIDK
jgi:hypothetical protein